MKAILWLILILTVSILGAIYIGIVSNIVISIYLLFWLVMFCAHIKEKEKTVLFISLIMLFVHCGAYLSESLYTRIILGIDMIFALLIYFGDNNNNQTQQPHNSSSSQKSKPVPNPQQQLQSKNKSVNTNCISVISTQSMNCDSEVQPNRNLEGLEKRLSETVKQGLITIEHVKDQSLVNRMKDYQMFTTSEDQAKAKILKVALRTNLLESILSSDLTDLEIENKINRFIDQEGFDYNKTFAIITLIYNCFRIQNRKGITYFPKSKYEHKDILTGSNIPKIQSSIQKMSSDSTESKVQETEYASEYATLKDLFKKNPDQARQMYGIPYSDYEGYGGRTLYNGNTILCKECITSLCKYLRLGSPTFSTSKKHSLNFSVRGAICTFTGTGAVIKCLTEDEYTMEKMAKYIYPEEFITIETY